MSLAVLKQKVSCDNEERERFKRENELLKKELATLKTNNAENVLIINGLRKENDELTRNLKSTSATLMSEINGLKKEIKVCASDIKAD